jgi:hypothetical protein
MAAGGENRWPYSGRNRWPLTNEPIRLNLTRVIDGLNALREADGR